MKLNQLIKEIKNNLSNGNYLSALALTLILPDICGEIAFPKVKFNRERYTRWYNEYIYPYELSPVDGNPYNEWVPNGEIIYKLRCSLLHDGSLDIEKDIKKVAGLGKSNKYKFKLTNNFTSINLTWANGDKSEEPSVLVRIGVEDFCEIVCDVAENYYLENCPNNDIYNEVVIFDFS